MKKIKLILGSLLLCVLSCDKDNDSIDQNTDDLICENCAIEVTKDNSRVWHFNQQVNLLPAGSQGAKSAAATNSVELTLNAIVDPLYVNHDGEEVLLNANHVAVKNKRIAASYSLIGAPYFGAIDIIEAPEDAFPSLAGTLLLPDRDIDAVDFVNRNHILVGGGFDAQVHYGGNHPSFLGRYQIKLNEETEVLSLTEKNLYHSIFGNKLRNVQTTNGIITGSGGGNSGIIFAYNENENTIIEHTSGETQGLYILDTSIEAEDKNYKFVALAYNDNDDSIKAFYYDISKETDVMTFSYEVSLGTYPNTDVEAKHSVLAIKKDYLIVSLGTEGIGVFKIETAENETKSALLTQQLKSELLNENNVSHVINSFVYKSKTLYVAAGGAGFYLIDYNTSQNLLKTAFSKMELPIGESVNSVAISDNDLLIASTRGVSIYTITELE